MAVAHACMHTIYLSNDSSMYWSIHLSIHLSIHPSIHPFIYLYIPSCHMKHPKVSIQRNLYSNALEVKLATFLLPEVAVFRTSLRYRLNMDGSTWTLKNIEVGLNMWSDREWIKQNLDFDEWICMSVLAGLQGDFGESLHFPSRHKPAWYIAAPTVWRT